MKQDLKTSSSYCSTGNNTRNNSTDGQLISQCELSALISQNFDLDGVIYGFAYGSGVLSQQQQPIIAGDGNNNNNNNNKSSPPMVDLIFVIDDESVLEWHRKNLARNSDHYSSLSRVSGAPFINAIQRNGVYFHPDIPVSYFYKEKYYHERLIKYGLVHKSTLMDDLLNWKYLYLSGRLHKPTVALDFLVNNSSSFHDEIHEALVMNAKAAISASLLLLKHQMNNNESISRYDDDDVVAISFDDLFLGVAGLSYLGDARFAVGAEDPFKVSKLVSSPGQPERWDNLYRTPLECLQKKGLLNFDLDRRSLEIESFSSLIAFSKQTIPSRIRYQCRSKHGQNINYDALETVISNVVKRSSRIQALRGGISAGVLKSMKYVVAKWKKGGWL